MSAGDPVVVIGAGGHAKVVVATLLELGRPIAAIVDDEVYRRGEALLGLPVSGPIAEQPVAGRPAVLAIGDNAARRRLGAELDCDWRSVVHPTAWVHPSVRLGAGVFVAAGALIQPDAVVGCHTIVNTGASIDHDCVLGGCCHVAPGAHLAGGVRLGEGVLFGVGAGTVPGVRVGEWTVVGAGATVIGDLPARVTAVGVPARVRADD